MRKIHVKKVTPDDVLAGGLAQCAEDVKTAADNVHDAQMRLDEAMGEQQSATEAYCRYEEFLQQKNIVLPVEPQEV